MLVIDLRGKVYGKLTVLNNKPKYIKYYYTGYLKWQCKCECGKKTWCSGGNLKSGRIKSCGRSGCRDWIRRDENFEYKPKKDRTGEKINELTIIGIGEHIKTKGDYIWTWRVRCTCGVEKNLSPSSLNGRVKSCGCLLKKHGSKLNFRDLTGEKIGKLTAEKVVGKLTNGTGTSIWRWRCECGGQIDSIKRYLMRTKHPECKECKGIRKIG